MESTMPISIPHYVDACVAVKLVSDEAGSDRIRDYVNSKESAHLFYITEFAFYETLSVLKRKLESPIDKGGIDKDSYHRAIVNLTGYLDDEVLQIDSEFRLYDWKVLFDVRELVDRHGLDYSDALQLYTVLNEMRKGNRAEFTTVFITADAMLAKAAKAERLRVWNLLTEEYPPDWDASGEQRGKVA
jgi:predicted nucleic acid-binding protein